MGRVEPALGTCVDAWTPSSFQHSDLYLSIAACHMLMFARDLTVTYLLLDGKCPWPTVRLCLCSFSTRPKPPVIAALWLVVHLMRRAALIAVKEGK